MSGWALAPAKVNLFLHVGARRADGYHPIASLMVFADVGDRLSLGVGTRLSVTGPFADQVPAAEGNLAAEAARAVGANAAIMLEKHLPVAAGLGGGSADAAAVLRLLGPSREREAMLRIANGLGSDVPACFVSRPLLAQGRGERLTPWPELPSLAAVLVWPYAAVATAAVYAALDAGYAPSPPPPGGGEGLGEGDLFPWGSELTPPPPSPQPGSGRRGGAGATAVDMPTPQRLHSSEDAASFLSACRNDLECPAIRLQPLIGELLDLLRAEPETLLARMSGSGSACFALCRTIAQAEALAERLAGRYPRWWVRACTLGEPPLWGDET